MENWKRFSIPWRGFSEPWRGFTEPWRGFTEPWRRSALVVVVLATLLQSVLSSDTGVSRLSRSSDTGVSRLSRSSDPGVSRLSRGSDTGVPRSRSHQHYCNPVNRPQVIDIDESGKWGHLLTPGFPVSLQTPLQCQWVLNYTRFTNNDDLSLFLYFTQVYVQHEYIGLRECQDAALTNCNTIQHPPRQAYFRLFGSPFLEISLDIPASPDVHFRVLEVSDVYGLNMTYEVGGKDRQREEFFKCSVSICRLNGECIVQASPSGAELERMECRCNSPLDDSSFSEASFYGDQCQYHNKHGHCTGPGDNHFDAAKRCSGHPCSYFTSRFVRCHCLKGYGGRSCKRIVERPSLTSVSPLDISRLRIKINESVLSKPLSQEHLHDLVLSAWQSTCNCSIISVNILNLQQRLVEIEMRGYPEHTKSLVKTCQERREISRTLPINSIKLMSSVPQVKIEKLSLNKEIPIFNSFEFIISCLAEGGPNMTFGWYKDDFQVNVSVTERYIMKDVRPEQVEGTNRWRNLGILHITNAKKYDSGKFRCEVEDEGSRVTLGLDMPVLVAHEPDIEIFPSALVLEQVGEEIKTSVKDSTVFCLTKDSVDATSYSFKWLRRYYGADKAENSEIDYFKDPEELEVLTFPVGILLRLKRIRRSAIYTCQITLGNMMTELEVPVDVIPRRFVESDTCFNPHADLSWPRTRINTTIRRPCSGDNEGFVRRKCEQRIVGYPGKWGEVDQDECLNLDLLMVHDHLQIFTSGYTRPGEAENLARDILTNLENFCKKGTPRPQEWSLMLKILRELLTYLHNADMKQKGVHRYDWSEQIYSVKHRFFNVIQCLLSDDAIRFQVVQKLPDILDLLRRNSLLLGRELGVGERTSFPILTFAVHLSKIDLNQIKDETTLMSSTGRSNGDEPGTQVYLSSRARRPVMERTTDHIFIVSLIFIEQLQRLVRENMDRAKSSQFELNSDLVTVGLESERRLVGQEDIIYQPADVFSIDEDFLFTIEFTFLNSSFNRTLRSVECGEIPTQSRRDFLILKQSPTCTLSYTNRTGQPVPTCQCSRTGTYGLLVSRPDPARGGVLVTGVSKPVVYGCLISLMLSIINWSLLFRAYFQECRKIITVLKVLTTTGVMSSSLILMLGVNRLLPRHWFHATSALLQISQLTSLACQLGISVLVLLQYRPIVKSRVSYVVVMLLAALGPAVVIGILSAGCGMDDSTAGDWWLKVGGFHFTSYISVLGVLLIFLGLMLWAGSAVLAREQRLASLEVVKTSGLEESVGTLRRVFIVSLVLVAYNALGVLYFNYALEILEYCFALACALPGVTLIFCYVLMSESYILVWCGDKETWREIKLHRQQIRGSHSESGASRSTNSSRNGSKPTKEHPGTHLAGLKEAAMEEDPFNSRLYPLTSIGSPTSPPVHRFDESSRGGTGRPTRPPLRAKCYILDNTPPYSARERQCAGVRNEPVPLAELLDRVAKQPVPLALLEEQAGKPSGLGHFEYRASSRRSTNTSNQTLVTSSDASEYVQQEASTPPPTKPLSRARLPSSSSSSSSLYHSGTTEPHRRVTDPLPSVPKYPPKYIPHQRSVESGLRLQYIRAGSPTLPYPPFNATMATSPTAIHPPNYTPRVATPTTVDPPTYTPMHSAPPYLEEEVEDMEEKELGLDRVYTETIEEYSRYSNYINTEGMAQNRMRSVLHGIYKKDSVDTSQPNPRVPSQPSGQEPAQNPVEAGGGQEEGVNQRAGGTLSDGGGVEEKGLELRGGEGRRYRHCHKKGLLKKIQSASEMSELYRPKLLPVFSSQWMVDEWESGSPTRTELMNSSNPEWRSLGEISTREHAN